MLDASLKSFQVDAILDLKVGAQVMLMKNMQSGQLANGSRGVVVDFVSRYELAPLTFYWRFYPVVLRIE
jgi:hypothetical protein